MITTGVRKLLAQIRDVGYLIFISLLLTQNLGKENLAIYIRRLPFDCRQSNCHVPARTGHVAGSVTSPDRTCRRIEHGHVRADVLSARYILNNI